MLARAAHHAFHWLSGGCAVCVRSARRRANQAGRGAKAVEALDQRAASGVLRRAPSAVAAAAALAAKRRRTARAAHPTVGPGCGASPGGRSGARVSPGCPRGSTRRRGGSTRRRGGSARSAFRVTGSGGSHGTGACAARVRARSRCARRTAIRHSGRANDSRRSGDARSAGASPFYAGRTGGRDLPVATSEQKEPTEGAPRAVENSVQRDAPDLNCPTLARISILVHQRSLIFQVWPQAVEPSRRRYAIEGARPTPRDERQCRVRESRWAASTLARTAGDRGTPA